MSGPLTYPPEIVIESSIELPPDFGLTGDFGPTEGFVLTEGHLELGLFVVEFVFELIGAALS